MGDIFKPASLVINGVLALSVPEQPAGNDHLAEIGVFLGNGAVVIVQNQGNFGHAHRGFAVGSGEDHIIHAFAAKLFGTLFAHDPFDGIHNIAFPASIGSHNPADPFRKRNNRLF